MTAEKSSSESNHLISFICSLPFWWLGIEGYQAAMLPSKTPDFLELYSWEKVIGLISILAICVIGIKFVHPKICSWIEAFLLKLNFSLPSPYLSFVCLFVLGSLFTISKGTVVGEDISAQVLSTQHFISGKINAPNEVLVPSTKDLSTDTQTWHIRPPGASWFALPGMFLGLPLGHAIKFTLVFVGLLGGMGWLKLSEKTSFKMSKLINSYNEEVLVGESTSVNLYKILYSLLNSCQFKKNLVTDCLNFPSDIYIIEGLKEYTEKKEITVMKKKDLKKLGHHFNITSFFNN